MLDSYPIVGTWDYYRKYDGSTGTIYELFDLESLYGTWEQQAEEGKGWYAYSFHNNGLAEEMRFDSNGNKEYTNYRAYSISYSDKTGNGPFYKSRSKIDIFQNGVIILENGDTYLKTDELY